MKRIIAIVSITIISVSIYAQQTPHYACFGGCIFIDSAGVEVVHNFRSNVFPISSFMSDFSGHTLAEWQQLEDKATAEATKQLQAMGYTAIVNYPILLSNYENQQKTQEALDVWDSRTPPDIQVQFVTMPAVGMNEGR